MLGHNSTAGRRREGNSGRNIEGVSAITPGAAGIDHEQVRTVAGQGASPTQHSRHRRQLNTIHISGAESGQEGPRLHRCQRFLEPGLHQGRCFRIRERAALQQMLQHLGP